jgi:serine/threonine protein kinase/tetratricopeptide (TPR) repeat protein
MPDRDQLLDQLAGAVLDGTDVDWKALESSAGSDAVPLLRRLQLVASVAKVHRDALPAETWGPLRLIERVGRGASGDVYRAWDTRLDREVALKLILAPTSADDDTASAIVTEGRLLAKIRHPNVVTIHGAERIGGCTGLWMEFVHGRTLDELFHQGRTFETVEIIGIGIELCRAVSAVHAAGLLHRDIKAHNVMRADDGRILLMDFGAGREIDHESPADVSGTPLYLAPELFRGEPASAQSDIYSLGVLLYRLASGSYPVSGRSIRELRAAHEAGNRVVARALTPVIAAGLAEVIDQAIDPRPERRPPTADALAALLVTLQRRLRMRPVLRASMIGAALLVVGVAIWALLPRPSTPLTPVPTGADLSTGPPASTEPSVPSPANTPQALVRVRPSLQVVPFVNASGQSDIGWMSAAFAEMLVREFRASEAFRWIPETAPHLSSGPRLAPALSGPMFVRWASPADIVVSGEYAASEPSAGDPNALRITVSFADRTGARATATVSEVGTRSNLLQLISRVGARARSALGVPALSGDQIKALAASQPANAMAARAYALGLNRGREAVPFMESALAADPRFAPAQVALAEGLRLREEYPKARAAATRAIELSAGLPFEERLLIATRATVLSAGGAPFGSQPPSTNEMWKQLYARYPDTLLYGVQVARAQLRTGQFEEGLATMSVISLLPGTSEDYELLQLESSLAQGARDYARAQLALDRAAKAASAADDQNQFGRIQFQRARLSLELGNPAAAVAFVQAAKQAGYDPTGVDDTLMVASRATGDFSGATTEVKGRLARARTARTPDYEVEARFLLASLLVDQGALTEARMGLVQLIRDGGPNFLTGDETKVRLALADVLYRRGEVAGARNELRRIASYPRQLARVLFEEGDLAGAREVVARSLQILRWNNAGSPSAIAWTLGLRARMEIASGDAAAARRTIDEVALPPTADRPRRSMLEPDRRDVFEAAVARALVALQDGRWNDSRALAQTAIALARGDFRRDDEAAGETVLALGWLGEGQLVEARAAIARAEPRRRITEDQLLRLSGGIAAVRVRAASATGPGLDRARQDLEALIRQADGFGAVATGFEARLALGEIEIKSGQVAAGRQRLEALGRDAAARGFSWIATKAAAAAR